MIDVLSVAEFAVDSVETLSRSMDSDSAHIPAARVPGRPDALFARSANGDFSLLIQCAHGRPVRDRQTESLRVSSSGQYLLADVADGSVIEATFSTVTLLAGHDELITSFGALCGALLAGLSDSPTSEELDTLLEDFVRLLAQKRAISREVVVGLWGELWLMSSASNVPLLATGWHEDVTGRYDFSLPNCRIEVKTTESADRVHSFSLAQLEEQQKQTWIASLCVVADPFGESIGSLLTSLVDKLDVKMRTRVVRISLATISGDLETISDYRFAVSGPKALALVPAEFVPRVLVPEGSGISHVHFRVDISPQAAMSNTSLQDLAAFQA